MSAVPAAGRYCSDVGHDLRGGAALGARYPGQGRGPRDAAWHIDKTIRIQEYSNDVSLTELEIATIGSWVAVGATEGDPKDLPDPDQRVAFGGRGVDEMSHAWVGMTCLDNATCERMVAEREGREANPGR